MATTIEPVACLICEDGMIPGMTGVCNKCGSRYRRGALVQEGKAPSTRRRFAPRTQSIAINFEKLPWQSLQQGETRVEAIENLWKFYRAHPHKYMRKDPSEAYEVIRAESESGGWWLTVRKVS